MSKHWRPDSKVVPLRPRRARREWTRAQSYWHNEIKSRPLPEGAKAGLVLVAAACLGVAVGVNEFVYKSPFVEAPASTQPQAIPYFGYCHSGGGTDCVVDGDTFYIGGAKVRIAGIDAPETHPPRCAREAELGRAATERLRALLNSGAVTMSAIDRDRDVYGRLLRNVAVDGRDVGGAMIGAGVAREYGSGRRSWC
jgi:endonuclease YncB( thermonuclease family)